MYFMISLESYTCNLQSSTFFCNKKAIQLWAILMRCSLTGLSISEFVVANHSKPDETEEINHLTPHYSYA